MKYLILSIIAVFSFQFDALAQPLLSFDIKKPKKFQNKKLGSEKTGEKKFTVPRRFVQNTVTHYNYYFNANTKLNDVLDRSKAAFKDDYTRLLPFYNYSVESTEPFKQDIDSVIYKTTAGILLHDLRNNWVDNLYLILGKAYYLRGDYDSAYLTFQYVNYAFSPKEKDGWDKVIGSNQNEGGSAFSISTKENNNIVHKAFTRPPSRNESFIWQIRSYLATDAIPEAAGLIQTLKQDPLFPERLHTDLDEMQAWWFYKQKVYDSSAFYLEKALSNAATKQEQARWEYLIAQLYERSGKWEQAKAFYARATKHTIDPLLEVYSILNSLRQGGEGNEKDTQWAIDQLIKMARKDKYFHYRDIVYYTAANIEAERKNFDGAKTLLLKSIKYSTNNPAQKSKSYLALGDIAFTQRDFLAAQSYYDSVENDIIHADDLAAFNNRTSALEKIAVHIAVILRQDSLQRVAAMPEEERTAFIKRLVKQLRRQQGLKDELARMNDRNFGSNRAITTSLFDNTIKGEWYFNNANLRTKGQTEFRSIWGDRPNSDNWRRSSAISRQFVVNDPNNPNSELKEEAIEITYDALLARLPFTPEQQKIVLDSTEHALFALGKAYQDGLEDYPAAITAYERLLSSFPVSTHAEEAWFNLYYCYGKVGKPVEQQRAKQMLANKFADGDLYAKLANPRAVSPDSLLKKQATIAYDEVYNLFIEGKFAEALAKKSIADSVYGRQYWTPQLLYIEAVYHIHERQDSAAKVVLNNIIELYPSTRMQEKSSNLLAVLERRQEIEEYLTNLQIDSNLLSKQQPVLVRKEPVIQQPDTVTAIVPDTPEEPEKDMVSANVKTGTEPVKDKKITIGVPRAPGLDTSKIKKPVIAPSAYTHRPEQAHLVVFVMNKVDPVCVSEARNAFNRYNRENYYDRTIELTNLPLTDDIKMLLFDRFENAGVAIEYLEKAKKLSASEIIPWLTPEKYSFVIISEENLERLKNIKDFEGYRSFLRQAYPGRGF